MRFLAAAKSHAFLSCRDILAEQNFKYSTYQRLYEKQLCKECKGEVIADQLQPVGQQRKYIKTRIIWIVEPCCQKTHRRAHQAYRCTDNCTFKMHRMSTCRIKDLAGQLKGTGTAHQTLQSIRKAKLDQDDCPDGKHPSKHIHTALTVDGMDYAVCPVMDIRIPPLTTYRL